MALRIAHGAFALASREIRASPPARRLANRSCEGTIPPACPPCPAPPRPHCRATPPTTARARRIVCCPPPAGNPPPCPPPPCAAALSCNSTGLGERSSKRRYVTSKNCGSDRDHVAQRLSLAERHRRLEYEREVAARSPAVASEPPSALYSLGVERECARATDGRDYAVKCERTPPAPCGPGRTPPPPRCVELMRDTECTIRDGAHVDPCSHVTRTIVEIDRSNHHAVSVPESSPPAKNLTSRIMERLSLNRNSDASCPKRSCEPKCVTQAARRAGDGGWCHTQLKPPMVPPCCREPTTIEKIKRRGSTHTSGKRTFHSSASYRAAVPTSKGDCKKDVDTNVSTKKSSKNAETLKNVLKERDNLQEAGQGRIVTDMKDMGKSSQNTTSGKLDIPVPLGAQNVRVRVSLDGAKTCFAASSATKATTVSCSASDGTSSKSNKNTPWISLKNLKKKLASCRKNENVKVAKDEKQEKPDPGTCPRPQRSPAKPPPPRDPCASPTPAAPPCAAPPPPVSAPSAPSAPSCPPRRTCPTHGKPTTPKKPTRFISETELTQIIV